MLPNCMLRVLDKFFIFTFSFGEIHGLIGGFKSKVSSISTLCSLLNGYMLFVAGVWNFNFFLNLFTILLPIFSFFLLASNNKRG